MKNKSLNTKLLKILFFVCSLINAGIALSQSDSITQKEFFAGELKLILKYNENDFFSGSIEVFDRQNNSVFFQDKFYSGYVWDTLINLDGDPENEFILDLSTGVNMYDYNMYLIFDFTKSTAPLLEIHNAELVTGVDENPKITSYTRLSPAVMGAGYTAVFMYDNGSLIPVTDTQSSKVLKRYDSDGSSDLELIKEYGEAFDECAKDSEVQVYYLAYLIQEKLTGQESRGWKFFEKHYKCRNKNSVRNKLQEDLDNNYNLITNPDNYKFSDQIKN